MGLNPIWRLMNVLETHSALRGLIG
jgi:hypothetical protein